MPAAPALLSVLPTGPLINGSTCIGNLNPALSRIIPKLETRISPLGYHLQSTTMNSPTLLALLLAISVAQAAPGAPEKGSRREAARNDAGTGDAREEFLKKHPELREKFEKLKDMTPEERHAFFKEHPELAEKLKDAGADRRGDFLKDHPELKEHLEKLKSMTPEERKAWLKEHPEVAEKIEKAKGKLKEKAEDATPEQKEKIKAKMKERFEKMTPEQQAEVLKNHPELKEKLEGAKK